MLLGVGAALRPNSQQQIRVRESFLHVNVRELIVGLKCLRDAIVIAHGGKT
jgi:hypothetical protein